MAEGRQPWGVRWHCSPGGVGRRNAGTHHAAPRSNQNPRASEPAHLKCTVVCTMLFCCGLVRKAQGSAVRHASSPSLAFLAGAAAAEPFSGQWTRARRERALAVSLRDEGPFTRVYGRGCSRAAALCPQPQTAAGTQTHQWEQPLPWPASSSSRASPGRPQSWGPAAQPPTGSMARQGRSMVQHAACKQRQQTWRQRRRRSRAAAAVQQQPRQQAPCSNTYSLNVTHRQPLTTHTNYTHLRLQLCLERAHVRPLDGAAAAAHLAQQDVQVAVVPAHVLMQQVTSEFAHTHCAAARLPSRVSGCGGTHAHGG